MLATWITPVLTGTAVISGCVDAIAGGGGLILLPMLLFCGLPPHMALGTNKVQSACGTGMATWRYHRAGLFGLKANLPMALVVFAGAGAGSLVIQAFRPDVLRLIVPLLLLAVALYTVLSPRMSDEDSHHLLSERGFVPVAAATGFYDGFFGPGAGQFYVSSLVALRGLGLTRATGVTKLFNFLSNIASVLVFGFGGHIYWGLGLAMAAGAMTGSWIGSHYATRLGARLIRPLLITCSLGMTARLLWGWFHA